VSGLEWTEGACLHDVLARAATDFPDVTALVSGETVRTFGVLHARVQRAAATIEAATSPGARVAVVGENHPAWVECYYAVPSTGRVLVFGNHRLAPAELRSVLVRSGASMVVGPRHELDRIFADAAVDPVKEVVDLDEWESTVAAGSAPPPAASDPAVSDPGAPAWLIYTSGTTGRSKGATLTHANVLAAVRIANACRIVADDEQYVLPFPLSHIAGFNVIHHHARMRPVILMPRFDARAFIDVVARHQVTAASLAATMLHSLLVLLEAEPALVSELRSLQLLAYGAAPMPVPLLRRGHELLGVDFHSGYGMTELSGNAVFLDVAGHRRGLAGDDALLATAGRPGPGVDLRLADDGEILIRSPQVMAGYWEEPDATAAALVDGWMHTGDIGRFDAEGNLAIVDRKKDVILTGGENVSSLEVEQVLHEIPEVGEVAVVAVPDPEWGENVCAVVVPHAGTTVDPDALVAAARSRLAGFKVPRHVVVVDELPKNGTGKILKQELRTWLAEHPERLGARR
jgi:acyl-CoA synthetase (AMP-forming)/AMP-acid ligase II